MSLPCCNLYLQYTYSTYTYYHRHSTQLVYSVPSGHWTPLRWHPPFGGGQPQVLWSWTWRRCLSKQDGFSATGTHMLHVWSISGWSPSQVTVKVPVYRDPLLAWDWGQPKIYLPIFGFSFLVNVQKNEPQRWTVWFVMKTHVRRGPSWQFGTLQIPFEQWPKPSLLVVYRGWNPARLYRDYNQPIQGSL